jgi:hypothetical protein
MSWAVVQGRVLCLGLDARVTVVGRAVAVCVTCTSRYSATVPLEVGGEELHHRQKDAPLRGVDV